MANRLDLADAQFVGFRHGKNHRSDIIGLVSSMGLTKKEWLKLLDEYSTSGYLDESEVEEINTYFGIEND